MDPAVEYQLKDLREGLRIVEREADHDNLDLKAKMQELEDKLIVQQKRTRDIEHAIITYAEASERRIETLELRIADLIASARALEGATQIETTKAYRSGCIRNAGGEFLDDITEYDRDCEKALRGLIDAHNDADGPADQRAI